MRLEGKAAIVTGAGSGIGRAAAIAMASDGASVTVVDRNGGDAERTVATIAETGGRAMAIVGDVSVRADVERVVAETVSRFGGVGILFNNAGVQLHKGLEATEEEEWDQLFAINVKGMFLFAKAVIPVMERAGGGVILNNASVASFRALMGGDTAYVASKGAVMGLTRDLAIAVAPKKIRVLAICPGPTRTGLLAQSLAAGVVSEDTVRALQLTDHIAEPEEIGRMAAFLVSPEARYVVGSGVSIDGGMGIL